MTGFVVIHLIYPYFKILHLLCLHVLGESKKRQGGWGVRVGTIPKMTQATVAPSLLAYLGLTIFRGSPVLRTRPDKDKDRRDEGVDKHSWG